MTAAQAHVFQATAGHWMVEVWVDGRPVQATAGCASEQEAIDIAETEFADDFHGMDYSIVRGQGRPDAPR